MGKRLGIQGRLYLATALLTAATDEVIAALTWEHVGNVSSVTLNRGGTEANMTTRDNDGWEQIERGLKQGSIEFTMKYDENDHHVRTFENAHETGDKVAVAVMSSAVTFGASGQTGRGLVSNWSVMQANREEPDDGPMELKVVLKPFQFTKKYTPAGS